MIPGENLPIHFQTHFFKTRDFLSELYCNEQSSYSAALYGNGTCQVFCHSCSFLLPFVKKKKKSFTFVAGIICNYELCFLKIHQWNLWFLKWAARRKRKECKWNLMPQDSCGKLKRHLASCLPRQKNKWNYYRHILEFCLKFYLIEEKSTQTNLVYHIQNICQILNIATVHMERYNVQWL